MKNIIYITITLVIMGCTSSPHDDVIETIHFDPDKPSDDVSFFDIFERVDIIPLELTDSTPIRNGIIMRVNNKKLYVVDCYKPKKIFIFNNEGKCTSIFDQYNDGPQGYLYITDFYVKDKWIDILEPIGSIKRYDKRTDSLSAKYVLPRIEGVPMALHCFMPLSDSKYAVYSITNPEKNMLFFDLNKKEYDNIQTIKRIKEGMGDASSYAFIESKDKGILFGSYLWRYIYDYDSIKQVFTPIIQYDFTEKYNHWEDYWKETASSKERINYLIKNNHKYVKSVRSPIFTDEFYLAFTRFSGKTYALYTDKKTEKSRMFYKTEEEVCLQKMSCNDFEYLYSYVPANNINDYVNEKVLDAKNMEILKNIKEDDNPVVLRYKLKDF